MRTSRTLKEISDELQKARLASPADAAMDAEASRLIDMIDSAGMEAEREAQNLVEYIGVVAGGVGDDYAEGEMSVSELRQILAHIQNIKSQCRKLQK